MKSFFKIISIMIAITLGLYLTTSYLSQPSVMIYYNKPQLNFWEFRSIDTMKYSRDLSREKLNDPEFDSVIDKQAKNIAAAGATHMAIATPYDKEFLPMLKRWVLAARKYNLKIWFRGNWSGWEKWFDYPAIDRPQHIELTRNFILENKDLFRDGDVFSSCPECENGGPGDPRSMTDAEGYRKFLIEEYNVTKSAFKSIGKKVQSNYFSMNADVAKLIMDRPTTAALDGIVTIDHYVKDPAQYASDVEYIANKSGGRIVLGEFGAPIPDIHGEMTNEQQAKWIGESLKTLATNGSVAGLNYWVSVGGSTEIWDEEGKETPGAKIVKQFYVPEAVYGTVKDELGDFIAGAKINYAGMNILSDKNGYFELPFSRNVDSIVKISYSGFEDKEINVKSTSGQIDVILVKKKKDLVFKVLEYLKITTR